MKTAATHRNGSFPQDVNMVHLDGRPERALIGCLMLDQNQYPLVAAMLTRESFREPECGDAWQAVGELFDAGMPIDTLTMAERMAAIRGDDTGLVIWCLEVMETVPYGVHAPQYAAMVRDSWQRRKVANLASDTMRRIRNPHEPVADTLARLESTLRQLSEGAVSSPATPIGETILQTLDAIGSGTRKRTPTGFQGLDGMIGGFRPRQLAVVGARPAMGKTAFVLNMLDNVASAGTPCGLISLEMSIQDSRKAAAGGDRHGGTPLARFAHDVCGAKWTVWELLKSLTEQAVRWQRRWQRGEEWSLRTVATVGDARRGPSFPACRPAGSQRNASDELQCRGNVRFRPSPRRKSLIG